MSWVELSLDDIQSSQHDHSAQRKLYKHECIHIYSTAKHHRQSFEGDANESA